jgi:hypothetical protein
MKSNSTSALSSETISKMGFASMISDDDAHAIVWTPYLIALHCFDLTAVVRLRYQIEQKIQTASVMQTKERVTGDQDGCYALELRNEGRLTDRLFEIFRVSRRSRSGAGRTQPRSVRPVASAASRQLAAANGRRCGCSNCRRGCDATAWVADASINAWARR